MWWGVFHSVSAFNNAGFSLWSNSLESFATDPWIGLPITAAVLVGGLGFPVLFEIWRQHRRPSRWSVHTKITMLMTAILVPAGMLFVLAAEWSNPATLGALNVPGRLLASFVQGVMPRTAGFSVHRSRRHARGHLAGHRRADVHRRGSGSTAGGIKVTTFALLAVVIWSELRGDPDVTFFDRRIPAVEPATGRGRGVGGCGRGDHPDDHDRPDVEPAAQRVLAEVVSASATVGLSTGITDQLAPWHQLLLVGLMFAGTARADHPRRCPRTA